MDVGNFLKDDELSEYADVDIDGTLKLGLADKTVFLKHQGSWSNVSPEIRRC